MRQRSLERSRPSILNEAPFLFCFALIIPVGDDFVAYPEAIDPEGREKRKEPGIAESSSWRGREFLQNPAKTPIVVLDNLRSTEISYRKLHSKSTHEAGFV